MPRKGSERGQTTASGMSSPSMADLLRPLATASVADAMTRCLAPVYERFRCELQEVFDEANASPNGPMRRDLYILWKNARLRAIAGPGEPRPWGPEEQQALHRVCDAHFRVSQVIHEDNHRARLALRDYCAEHGVSMRDGWRELASVALLEIIDDRGESRRVGDPEMPFARLPIADPTTVYVHVRRILRREVVAFLLRRPPGSKYQHVLTDDGELPESEDVRARLWEDSEARLDLATFEGVIEPDLLARLAVIPDTDPDKRALLAVLTSLSPRERELLVVGVGGRDYDALQQAYGGTRNSLQVSAHRAKRKAERLLAEARGHEDTQIA